MNIEWIGRIAKDYPAIARWINIGIITGMCTFLYMIGNFLHWVPIDWSVLYFSFIIPIIAGWEQMLRNIEKE